MKKILIITLMLSLIFAFSSCSNNNPPIKSISINEKTYFPIYLYSYSDASLAEADVVFSAEAEQTFQALAKNGYFLSTNRYDVGETIVVEFSCFYGQDGLKLTNEEREKYAYKNVNINITNVEKRGISIKEKEDTFVVSYSNIDSMAYNVNCNDSYIYRKYSSLSQSKDRLNEIIVLNEIETVKENIVISYDT